MSALDYAIRKQHPAVIDMLKAHIAQRDTKLDGSSKWQQAGSRQTKAGKAKYESVNERLYDEWKNVWMNERMNYWMNDWMDGRMLCVQIKINHIVGKINSSVMKAHMSLYIHNPYESVKELKKKDDIDWLIDGRKDERGQQVYRQSCLPRWRHKLC